MNNQLNGVKHLMVWGTQVGTLNEAPFCIRQLEPERILKEMIG